MEEFYTISYSPTPVQPGDTVTVTGVFNEFAEYKVVLVGESGTTYLPSSDTFDNYTNVTTEIVFVVPDIPNGNYTLTVQDWSDGYLGDLTGILDFIVGSALILQGDFIDLPVVLNIYESDKSELSLGSSYLSTGFLWDRRRLENFLDTTTRYESLLGGVPYGVRDGIRFDWFSSGVLTGGKYEKLTHKYIGDYRTWTPVVKTGAYNSSHHAKPLFSDYSFTSRFAADILDGESMFHVLHDDVVYSSIRVALYKRNKNLIEPYWVFNEVEEFDGEIVSGERTTQGLTGWNSNGNQRKKQYKIVDGKVILNGSHFINRTITRPATPPAKHIDFVIDYLGQSTGQGKKLSTKFLPVQKNSVSIWYKNGDNLTQLEEVSSLNYVTEQRKYFEFDYDLGIATLSGYQAPNAYLFQSIDPVDTTIYAQTEDYYLDTYPQRGIIQIGSELILYAERTKTAFIDCIRGYNDTAPTSHDEGALITHKKQGADVTGQLYIEYKAVPRIDYEITSYDKRTANKSGWLDIRPTKNVTTNNLLQIYPGQQNVDRIELETTAPSLGGNLYGPVYFGTDATQLIAKVYDSSDMPVDEQAVTIKFLDGAGYLNGEESSFKGLTNSNGEIFVDYTIPYESRFVEFQPLSISHVGTDTHFVMSEIDSQLQPSDFWVFQILKHDKYMGSIGLELTLSSQGSATRPYGAHYFIVDNLLDESYLNGLIKVTVGSTISWRTVTYVEQIFSTTNKSKVYVDATVTGSITELRIFKEDEIQWDSQLLNGMRRVLYSYDATAQHPLTGALGAYYPVQPDEISGNTLVFKDMQLPLPAPTDNDNNLGGYVIISGREISLRAETIDPLTGWLKLSNVIRLSIRIPNFLLGVTEEDGVFIPHGFRIVSDDFNQGSAIGLPNFLTINPIASGINRLNIQLTI